MADNQRKTYTTLFKLAGQMDNSFSAVFNAANQNVNALKRNFEDLNDIAGQNLLNGGAGRKIEKWKDLQSEWGDFLSIGDRTSAGTSRENWNQSDWETYFREYDDYVDGQLKAEQESAKEYQRQYQEYVDEQLKAEQESIELYKQQEAAAVAAYAGMAVAAGGALKVMKDIYVSVSDTTAQYQYTMSEVEALSGAYGAELDALNQKARDLGENTVFTAQQSATAMTYMAQAGWDTSEMLGGMDGVIALAAASGTDLATSSSIAADTLAGFRMEASETSRMADVLAQTAASSNTNVELIGETFKNTASIAGLLGFSIEDVSAMLGIMANSGVKGSRAGTALKNILNGLAGDATLTAEAFGEVQITMFNEDGTAKSLSQTLDELRGSFSQMTEKEQLANARALAGERGYNALAAVLGATTEEYEKMYAEINNCTGAAQRMADVRLDNLKGDVTLLNSAWESLTLTVGEQWQPAARSVVGDLTSIVQWLNRAAEAAPALSVGLEMIGGGLAAGLGAITVAGARSAILKFLDPMKLMAIKAFLTGPAGIVAGIAAAAGALFVLINHLRGVNAESESVMKTHRELMKQVDETNAGIYEEWAAMSQNSAETQEMIDRFHELAEVEGRSASQKLEMATLVDALNERISDLGLSYDYLTDSISGATGSLQEWYDEQQKQERMQHYRESYSDYMGNRKDLSDDVVATKKAMDAAKIKLDKTDVSLASYDIYKEDYIKKKTAYEEAMTEYRGNEQNILHASEEYEARANGYDSARAYEYAARHGELSNVSSVVVENFNVSIDGANKTNEDVAYDIADILTAMEEGTILYDR